MYYLLGFRLLGGNEADKAFTEDSELESKMSKTRNRKKGKSKKDNLSRPIKALFSRMDTEQYERVCLIIPRTVELFIVKYIHKTATTRQNKQCANMACTPSVESVQYEHPPSSTRVFPVRSLYNELSHHSPPIDVYEYAKI